MRVFVAGATGVLGRTVLAELFAHGHAVVALARSQDKATLLRSVGAEPIPGDLLAPATFQHALTAIDAVCNLATVVPRPPALPTDWLLNDVVLRQGVAGLLGAARRMNVPYYVQQSSSDLYLPQGDVWLVEDAKTAPQEPLRAFLDAESEVASSGLPFAVLRAGIYYGAGTPLTERLAAGVSKGLLQLSHSGENWLSPTHLFDMAKAIRLCIEQQPKGRIYNVCDDAPLQERVLLASIAEESNARVECSDDAPPDSGWRVSNARLRTELGFVPYYPSALGAIGELRGG
ncbi:MAG: NAD-dependent epimerase/dehydratase family protein [Thermaerobacter sp.]|nr:NAD-dependent epimerase/dehydratase family protein [Thermaerobacter sp.]